MLAILRTLAIPAGSRPRLEANRFSTTASVPLSSWHSSKSRLPDHVGALEAVKLLAIEAVGGIVFGLAAGLLTYWLLAQVDDYKVEILLTLGLASGGYALADRIGVSAPIAIVVAGLLIGNEGREKAMSKRRVLTRRFLGGRGRDSNAILFLLIGAELLLVPLNGGYGIAALVAVPLVLIARLVSVAAVVLILSPFRKFEHGTIPVLTWSGVRGGISVALALSVPYLSYRNTIIAMTYAVVVFSIIVQGLTIRSVILRTIPSLRLASEPNATTPLSGKSLQTSRRPEALATRPPAGRIFVDVK